MIPVRRLNHAVLYVHDADTSADFYGEALGLTVVTTTPRSVFMRATGSVNHHDLGLFTVGEAAPRAPAGSVGLYHLAWEVDSINDLVTARETLGRLHALRGESDHGAAKSVYGADPDGNEFEVMWRVPIEHWGVHAQQATTVPLDLPRDIARFGS